MALVGVQPGTLVSEPDALTTRPPSCATISRLVFKKKNYFDLRKTILILRRYQPSMREACTHYVGVKARKKRNLASKQI